MQLLPSNVTILVPLGIFIVNFQEKNTTNKVGVMTRGSDLQKTEFNNAFLRSSLILNYLLGKFKHALNQSFNYFY
jgi:hypothetical protein